ncbi:flagellar basal body P-ring formation chaperone FlgA [Enterobacteriaceae bacterium H16N7]|nr:flagellar basal body P-ring formation chaperone FlgA [Dryocola clanedunensis]
MTFSALRRKASFLLKPPLAESLVLLLTLLPLSAQAAHPPLQKSARDQINARVIVQAGMAIDNFAAQKQWQDYRYKLNVFIPPMTATLPPCSIPLTMSSGPFTLRTLARINYSVKCAGKTPWSVIVAVKPDIYLPVVMTKEEILRGETLDADRLILRKYNIANQRGELFYSIADVVGLSAKRPLSAFKPVMASQLQMPTLVKRDQPVTIISEVGNISAQTAGVAMKNGRKGDVIKVRNDSSQRVVTAAVEEPGVVKVVSAGTQNLGG